MALISLIAFDGVPDVVFDLLIFCLIEAGAAAEAEVAAFFVPFEGFTVGTVGIFGPGVARAADTLFPAGET